MKTRTQATAIFSLSKLISTFFFFFELALNLTHPSPPRPPSLCGSGGPAAVHPLPRTDWQSKRGVSLCKRCNCATQKVASGEVTAYTQSRRRINMVPATVTPSHHHRPSSWGPIRRYTNWWRSMSLLRRLKANKAIDRLLVRSWRVRTETRASDRVLFWKGLIILNWGFHCGDGVFFFFLFKCIFVPCVALWLSLCFISELHHNVWLVGNYLRVRVNLTSSRAAGMWSRQRAAEASGWLVDPAAPLDPQTRFCRRLVLRLRLRPRRSSHREEGVHEHRASLWEK